MPLDTDHMTAPKAKLGEWQLSWTPEDEKDWAWQILQTFGEVTDLDRKAHMCITLAEADCTSALRYKLTEEEQWVAIQRMMGSTLTCPPGWRKNKQGLWEEVPIGMEGDFTSSPVEPPTVKAGAKVAAKDLVGAAILNGKEGTLVEPAGDRWIVRFEGHGDKALLPKNFDLVIERKPTLKKKANKQTNPARNNAILRQNAAKADPLGQARKAWMGA